MKLLWTMSLSTLAILQLRQHARLEELERLAVRQQLQIEFLGDLTKHGSAVRRPAGRVSLPGEPLRRSIKITNRAPA